MRRAFSWLAIFLLGMALGIGGAVMSLRSAAFGDDIRSGPWSTGRAIGTADADIRTRAIVALRGLLALPASEARYFTARTDSTGEPLSGKCSYTIEGGVIEARWWSITLYDRAGWLIPNSWNRHSVGSASVPADDTTDAAYVWVVTVSPSEAPGLWIPTSTDGAFELTLRTYRPRALLAADPSRVSYMPDIVRGQCAP